MHRLFVALGPPEVLIDRLVEAMEGGPPGLRWEPEERLHLTLRFIGEVERPMAEDIAGILATLKASPVMVALSGVGRFDHGRRGALWAGVTPREPLVAFHAKIDHALVRAGLPPERRAYHPHITLARWSGGSIDPLPWLDRHGGLTSEPVTIDRFHLYESHLGRHGPTYEAAEAYPLAG